MKSTLVSAATAMAVAAASLVFIAWMATGPGVGVARWAEVRAQRLFPGGMYDAFVEPSWSTPGSLNAMGLLVYEERPEGTMGVCMPGLVAIVVVSTLAACVHAAVCLIVARLRRPQDGYAGPPLRMHRYYRLSALAAITVPIGICLLRWFWAGAERGSITQRVVGGSHVEFAFGPFGRAAVLLGGLLLYVGMLLWTARRVAKAAANEPAALSDGGGTKPAALWPAVTVTTLAVALLLFPYWAVQTLRVVGQGTAIKIGQWSETTPLRGVLEKVAPMP